MRKRLIFVGGDGIGPEVTAQTKKIAAWLIQQHGLPIDIQDASYGFSHYEDHGTLISSVDLELCDRSDAILFGAIGGDRAAAIESSEWTRAGLPALRKRYGLYANVRPIKAALDLGSPYLNADNIRGTDFVIVRELIGGVYFGQPRGIETLSEGERRGFDTQCYTTEEIRRVARAAFKIARTRKGRICSVDKCNVMESGVLWREEVSRLHQEEFSDLELTHYLADNCAMQIVRNPRQFDVIVADNLFGDILSDCAAMIAGSLGMLPSAALRGFHHKAGTPALYEPVHGSAPDIAGKNIANPIASILSLALAFRYSFDADIEATMLESSVTKALQSGCRTRDIAMPGGASIGTDAMGDAVLRALQVA